MALCALVAVVVFGVFNLPLGRSAPDVLGPELLVGWARALLPILVLEAAALAASALTSRAFGPVLLVGLFVAGSLGATGPLGAILPDFGLFGLEAGAAPRWGALSVYTATFTAAFFLVAYLVLSSRIPLRSQS